METRRNNPKASRTGKYAWQKLAESIKQRDHRECVKCGRSEEDGFKLEIDHIIPWHAGGLDTPDNLETLCKDICHKEKTRSDEQARRAKLRDGEAEPPWSREWY